VVVIIGSNLDRGRLQTALTQILTWIFYNIGFEVK
jgi:hypothetical protein